MLAKFHEIHMAIIQQQAKRTSHFAIGLTPHTSEQCTIARVKCCYGKHYIRA